MSSASLFPDLDWADATDPAAAQVGILLRQFVGNEDAQECIQPQVQTIQNLGAPAKSIDEI
jgi:hypothetical protein